MEKLIIIGDAPSDTIVFTCNKMRFEQDGTIVLSLEVSDFILRFDKIVFEVEGKKVVYRKEN